jgi:hypothetical protein
MAENEQGPDAGPDSARRQVMRAEKEQPSGAIGRWQGRATGRDAGASGQC